MKQNVYKADYVGKKKTVQYTHYGIGKEAHLYSLFQS